MKTKRPEDLPFPNVWSKFSRTAPNGVELKFKIQDCPNELLEDLFLFMCEYFMKDELLNNAVGIQNEKLGIEEFKAFQLLSIAEKLTCICVKDDEVNYDMDNNKPEIIGFSITYVSKLGEENDFKPKSETIGNLFKVFNELESRNVTYKTHNVDQFLGDAGLSVHPAYRNLGIGKELLKSRFLIAKTLGLKVVEATFSSEASQKSAYNTGFRPLVSISYEELSTKYNIDFKTTSKSIIIMTKCIE